MRHMIFGESHGPAIGVVLEGVPAGLELDLEQVQWELDRRRPGKDPTATARKEADRVEVLSGLFEGKTTGAPLAMVIYNSDQRSKDYESIRYTPRPGHGDYAGFIQRYAGRSFPPGAFVGTAGQVYGQHKGIIHYTVGQRKGLGLSFPQPMFVKELDVENNQVVLSKAEELFSQTVAARDVNLISVESIPEPLRVKARVRYRQKEQPATVVQTGPDELRVVFDQPQRAITPGQALVLYDGDTVVGGGRIVRN